MRCARAIAQQLLEAVQGFRYGVTAVCRLQASAWPRSPPLPNIESVMAAADTACFRANNCRNQVQVFHYGRRGDHGAAKWAGLLVWHGIEETASFWWLQHADNIGGRDDLDYVEVLPAARRARPRVPPMAFIPAAERYQLMGNGSLVVKRVLHCLSHYESPHCRRRVLCVRRGWP